MGVSNPSKTFTGGSHHCQGSSSLLVHKHTSLRPSIILIGVSLPGLCSPVHCIPQGYREFTPSFRSTIPIKSIGALNIDREYSPFCLISSLDSENFTPRFPLLRAFSFQSFSQSCSPHFHCRKDLLTTSCLLLRGLNYLMPFIKFSYLA